MVRPALWLVAEFAESEEDASAALDVIAAALPPLAATDQVHTRAHVHMYKSTLARTRTHARINTHIVHLLHTHLYIYTRTSTLARTCTRTHTIARTYRHNS